MRFFERLLKSVPASLGAILLVAGAWPGIARAACQLGNGVQHVVYVEFDNVHFTRDNPNVPSDLEQMPHLLNFIKQNGTLDAGDHAVLISHTANDILTTQTGLYSDDDGIAVANNFGVFDPAGVAFPSSFFYWTDLVQDITPATMDSTFALTTPAGDNVSRAVGAVHARWMRRRRLLDRQHRARAVALRRRKGLRQPIDTIVRVGAAADQRFHR